MEASSRRVQRLKAHLEQQQPGGEHRGGVAPEGTSGLQLGGDVLAEYDYVVVGAGSAGCVVASRLSEDPRVSVLLLEAGGSNQNFHVRQPLVTCPRLQNTAVDWAFRSAEQAGTANRVSFQPRGKMLGGCSSINYMIYCRGDPRNYDQWEREHGCTGWAYEDMVPFFRKSESLEVSPEMAGRHHRDSHGFKGPLTVTDASDPKLKMMTRGAVERFVRACDEAGVPANSDYNGPTQEGAGFSQVTIKDGVRCDTASSFLFKTGALERPNLTVACYAHVMRVVFQGDKATGVTFKSGQMDLETLAKAAVPTRFVGARREVVLCGGAYQTPQLLMLSGIGPREHLEEMGVPVVADLPGVGANLQDHLMVPISYAVHEQHAHFRLWPRDLFRQLVESVLWAQGVFMLPFVMAVAFFRSGLRPAEDGNDIGIHFVPFGGGDKEEGKRNLGFDPEKNPRFDVTLESGKSVTILASLLRPKSCGEVRLRSANPFEHPIIDPHYLEDPQDLAALKVCYRRCRDIAERSAAFRGFLAQRILNPFSPHHPESEEYMEEHIREEVVTIYHPVGTAKMGRAEDRMAVVDPQSLRVHGVRGLRVADASVMPDIVSGNTNAPAIAIGERAAHFMETERQRAESGQAEHSPGPLGPSAAVV